MAILQSTAIGFPALTYPATQGIREDLLDLVTNLDKNKEAATFLALPKTTTNSLIHEWQTDTLAATSTAAFAEGAAWTSAETLGARSRMANLVQTFRRDFDVSMDQVLLSQRSMVAGVSNELDHQVGKKLMEVTQSIDARILDATTANGSSISTVTRTMGALRSYMITASHATNVSGAFATGSFLALHEAMFTNGANPDTMIVSPGVKIDVTRTFLNDGGLARLQYTQPSSQVYDQSVEYIRTDFGRLAIIVDRFCPQSTAVQPANATALGAAYYLIEKAKVRIAFWRQLKWYPLAPAGDSFRGYVHGACTLEVLSPTAIGMGYNVTT